MKLPTRAETVYTYGHSDEVAMIMGSLSSGLEAIIFEDNDAADEWLRKSGHKEFARLDVSRARTYTTQIPYNPDLEA